MNLFPRKKIFFEKKRKKKTEIETYYFFKYTNFYKFLFIFIIFEKEFKFYY